METCRTVHDYAEYTSRVREYAARMPLDEAVERAITECISEGILADFLRENRAEAKKVSIYEYDEERHMRQTREEGVEEGYANGLTQGIEQTAVNLIKTRLLTDEQIKEDDRFKPVSDRHFAKNEKYSIITSLYKTNHIAKKYIEKQSHQKNLFQSA